MVPLVLRASIFALAAFLMVLPTAEAAFDLDGELRPERAFVLRGALTMKATGIHEFAFFRMSSPAGGGAEPLLASPDAEFVVTRWTTSTGAIDGALLNPEETRTFTVQEAAVSTDRVGAHAQGLLHRPRLAQVPFEAGGTFPACTIEHGAGQPGVTFPDDPASAPPQVKRLGTDRTYLQATCSAGHLEVQDADAVELYDFDLLVSGANHAPERIRTGTWQEDDPTGLPLTRTVTTKLRVNHIQPLALHPTSDVEARFAAPGFLGAGTLEAQESQGRLSWGDWSAAGPIGPFTATGAFDFSAADAPAVAVQGTTLDGPGFASTSAAPARSWVNAPAAAVAAAAAVLALLWCLWALFTRLQPRDLLAHPRREMILTKVTQEPGIHANALRADLGFTWVNAMHHIRSLQRGGHLVVKRVGGRTALFPANGGYRGREERVALMRNETLRCLAAAVAQAPGCSATLLAGELGMARSWTTEALGRLERAGLLSSRRVGRERLFFLAAGPE